MTKVAAVRGARFWIFLLGICCAGLLLAAVSDETYGASGMEELKSPEIPWRIKANKLIYKEKEGLYIAEGNVEIKKGGQILRAHKAIYNRKTGIVEIWGDVRFESQGNVIEGEKGTFYLKEQTGRLEHARILIRDNALRISGRSMEKVSENTYRAQDCIITTCAGQRPAWSITASEVKVTIEGYGTAKDAAFRIKNVPVLYLPYFIFPAKTKRQSGLLTPRAGYSGRNGLDMEIPFFWAISDQTDATFYERYMTNRGFMQGLEFRYAASRDSGGAILFDILSDRKEKDLGDPDDVELSPLPRTNETRYWLRGKGDQGLPLGIRVRTDVDYVSDQDYLKEFTRGLSGYEARPNLEKEWGRPMESMFSPFRSSNLLVSRLWDGAILQADSHYYQDPGHPSPNEVPQPLAGIHFFKSVSPIPGLPIKYFLESDYRNIWRDHGEKGNEFSIGPRVTMPLRLNRFLEIEPSASVDYNGRWINTDSGETDYRWASAYGGNLRLSSRLSRKFEVSMGQIKRVRHSIVPSLVYTYHEQRSDEDPSWFEPLSDTGKINKLTFSLENYLDARFESKSGRVTYRQWALFNISQSYNIDEARKSLGPGEKRKPFDPLELKFIMKPFHLLDVYWTSQWDHYDHDFLTNDLSVNLWIPRTGGRKDHYRVEYQTGEGENRNLGLLADVGLIWGFSAGGYLSKDFYANEEISSSLWLNYSSQCWGMKVQATRGNGETTFMVSFELRGLGQFRPW
ncbi:MAG: hypothetical protein DRH12_08470 [Deltaproteobacteria bacterium]|nr:MAG: hypothetical protein DRH12_08470 [Deltaproteobacteria bacterium]